METFELKGFFLELLELSYTDLRPGWGNPCSELLKKMCLRQEPWLRRIEGDYTGDSHEVRLNGAGLKMHWRVVKSDSTGERTFKCHISGDQVREYPMFVAQARRLIEKYGYNRR